MRCPDHLDTKPFEIWITKSLVFKCFWSSQVDIQIPTVSAKPTNNPCFSRVWYSDLHSKIGEGGWPCYVIMKAGLYFFDESLYFESYASSYCYKLSIGTWLIGPLQLGTFKTRQSRLTNPVLIFYISTLDSRLVAQILIDAWTFQWSLDHIM